MYYADTNSAWLKFISKGACRSLKFASGEAPDGWRWYYWDEACVVARVGRVLSQWEAVTVSCASARALGRQVLVDIRGHRGNYSSEVHPIGSWRYVSSPTVMLCWHAWRQHIGRRRLAEWHSLLLTCLEYTSTELFIFTQDSLKDNMTYTAVIKNQDKRSLRKVCNLHVFRFIDILYYVTVLPGQKKILNKRDMCLIKNLLCILFSWYLNLVVSLFQIFTLPVYSGGSVHAHIPLKIFDGTFFCLDTFLMHDRVKYVSQYNGRWLFLTEWYVLDNTYAILPRSNCHVSSPDQEVWGREAPSRTHWSLPGAHEDTRPQRLWQKREYTWCQFHCAE